MNTNRIRPRPLFAALLLACFFAACPMEDGNNSGPPAPENRNVLDPKLVGTWDGYFPSSWERYVITTTKNSPGFFGTLEYGGSYSGSYANSSSQYEEYFAGDIVWVEKFSDKAGVIIIEYFPGREGTWINLGNQKNPNGYTFYGIYYHQMNGSGAAGTTIYFSNTNDQSPSNRNGPTETETLAQAKAKFTQANMPNLMNQDVGLPQTKK